MIITNHGLKKTGKSIRQKNGMFCTVFFSAPIPRITWTKGENHIRTSYSNMFYFFSSFYGFVFFLLFSLNHSLIEHNKKTFRLVHILMSTYFCGFFSLLIRQTVPESCSLINITGWFFSLSLVHRDICVSPCVCTQVFCTTYPRTWAGATYWLCPHVS